jgi:predicted nucleic acid-binding protein
MSAEHFIDTNIFIYHLDTTDARKHRQAETIVRNALATGQGCISTQVAQECLNVALRKAKVALSPKAAHQYLEVVLAPLIQVVTTASLLARAMDNQVRWGFSFYDSLIIAGAQVAGCRLLYSEDLQHDQDLDGLRVVNPFA